MPTERPALRVLGVAALLVVALGLGALPGTPGIAVAQEDTPPQRWWKTRPTAPSTTLVGLIAAIATVVAVDA